MHLVNEIEVMMNTWFFLSFFPFSLNHDDDDYDYNDDGDDVATPLFVSLVSVSSGPRSVVSGQIIK